jgi:adenylate cyclase
LDGFEQAVEQGPALHAIDPASTATRRTVSKEQVIRRLAAIMVIDVVGYARLMSVDESGTHFRLKAHRTQRIEPIIRRRRGRLIKLTGDGAMIEFASAVEALSAAIEVQQVMADANRGQPAERAIVFRIGLDLGDLIVDDNELYGDGVNIAVRLEAVAPPGGIAISATLHDAVAGRLEADYQDLGGLELKNIDRPVRAFRVVWSAADWSQKPGNGASLAIAAGAALAGAGLTGPPPLPDKPSIAILPFTNMSADPEQEYFTDGMTEDIITEMSRFHEIFVIARNSTFTYKGRSVDVRLVATELGVRYVLEGSIRKAANRVRVTGQLIDALSGSHIWAERYDRVLKDIFAVQEELTRSIVRAIAPQILESETEKIHRRRPEDLNAYEIAARASAKAWEAWPKSDKALRDAAIADAAAALAIDPRSTTALGALAFAQWQHLAFASAVDRAAAWRDGMRAAERAIEIDRSLSFGHSTKALLLAFAPDRDRIDEALASAQLSYDLNPHSTAALGALSFIEILSGEPDRAIEHLLEALRLSPRDPLRPTVLLNLAMASGCARRYADGVNYATLGIREAPGFAPLHAHLAVNYVGLGEIAKARAALDESTRLAPGQVERSLAGFMFRKQEHQRRGTTFLRVAAGLEDPAAADPLR